MMRSFICLLFTFSISSLGFADMAIEQLQQRLKENRLPVETSHFIYTKENNVYAETEYPYDPKIHYNRDYYEISKRKLSRFEVTIDTKTSSMVNLRKDLRDIDSIQMEYKLSDDISGLIRRDMSQLTIGDIGLTSFTPGDLNTKLFLSKTNNPNYYEKTLYMGTIESGFLSHTDKDFNVLQVLEEGEKIVRLEFVSKENTSVRCVYDFYPEMQYRLKKEYLYYNDSVREEVVYDDYRKIGGIYYPYLVIERHYQENGVLSFEEIRKTEKAEFEVELTENDFRLFIPEGASLYDAVHSFESHVIKEAGFYGVDDFKNMFKEKVDVVVDDQLANLGQTLSEKVQSVFLPDYKHAAKSGKSYIFNFENESFVEMPIPNMTSKEAYDYLLKHEQGDVAWNDGEFIGLRKSKIVVSEAQKDQIINVTNEWCNQYRFMKEPKLPYNLIYVSSTGVCYQLTIKIIRSDGIEIEYKRQP